MSATIIYGADHTGDVVEVAEFKNSWGSAMLIWDYLAAKYHPKPPDLDVHDLWTYCTLNPKYIRKIWDLQNADIPLREKALLFSTFDNAMCRREALPKLADLFEEANPDIIRVLGNRAINLNHIPAQAQVFRAITDAYSAICWQQTNCGPFLWFDNDADAPYNINTGTKHWYIDDELFAKST